MELGAGIQHVLVQVVEKQIGRLDPAGGVPDDVVHLVRLPVLDDGQVLPQRVVGPFLLQLRGFSFAGLVGVVEEDPGMKRTRETSIFSLSPAFCRKSVICLSHSPTSSPLRPA